jgi:sugar phosphate isomerase/epimerase
MKLAFSTNAYTRFPLGEALRDIAEAGFEGVEILCDVPHAYPDALDNHLVRQVSDQLRNFHLSVSNLNCNCTFGYWKDAPPEPYFEPSLISPNPRHRADRSRMIVRALRFAAEIGAPCLSITSGRLLGGMSPDKARGQFMDGLGSILREAEKLQIDLGIECEPGLYVEYVDELVEWIRVMNSPRLGANLDIGHCAVLGESIPDAIRELQGRIWNMHVEDIPGRKHYHLVPGEGSIDWPGVRQALLETGYDRYLTVELYTHTADPGTAARKSHAFLSEWIRGSG